MKSDYQEQFVSFNEEIRLDDFYCSMLKSEKYSDLLEFLKVLLILSHGNAAVESGFSINKDMIVENLKEDSLIGVVLDLCMMQYSIMEAS